MKIQYGNIEFVNARTEWPNEAQDFTPWVAKNLDKISTATGLSLELVKQEAQVGPFRTDIVARNKSDGSMAVIENQFEDSDHDHLGKILTYLTGHEALTAIWIAEDFSEPHLAAIRWLNQNTSDSFDFFALQVGAVRVGDSPQIPIFHAVESPNTVLDFRVKIDELFDLSIDEAWQYETDLTGWVAGNSSKLSDLIGIPLKLEGRNLRTPNELIAQDNSGNKVLIVNQIKSSDAHVIWILQRQAALSAHTVIWIAPSFHEFHIAEIRSAIVGMDNPFSLFAVKVEAFQVKGFPSVACFSVLDDMPIRAMKSELRGGPSNLGDARQAFWEYYSVRYPQDGDPIKDGRRSSNVYHKVPGVDLEISQYLAGWGVGVYIKRQRQNAQVSVDDLMGPYAAALIDALGIDPKDAPMQFVPRYNEPFFGHRSVGLSWWDRNEYTQAADWLNQQLTTYLDVFTETPFRRDFWNFYSERHPDDGIPKGHVGAFADHPVEGTQLVIAQSLDKTGGSVFIDKEVRSSVKESVSELMRPYIPSLIDALGYDPENSPPEFAADYDGPLFAYLDWEIDWKNPANHPEAADILHNDLLLCRTAITQTPFYRDFWKFYSEQHSDDNISKDYSVRSAYHLVEGHKLEINQYLGEDDKGPFVSISIGKSRWSQTQEALGELMRPYIPALVDALPLDPNQLPAHFTPEYDGTAFGELSYDIDWKEPVSRTEAADILHDYLVLYRDILTKSPAQQSQ